MHGRELGFCDFSDGDESSIMPKFDTWTATLADHAGLDTITDFQGFTWIISADGQRAALLYGPPAANGRYDWSVAKAIGQDVDLALPASAHTQYGNGPCRQEIFLYLINRKHHQKDRPQSTQIMPISHALLQR
jgi:hypothetical protein